jgi:hypothetical protein
LNFQQHHSQKLKTGSFERAIHEFGCYVVDWIVLAQDLVQWCSVEMRFLDNLMTLPLASNYLR